MSKTVTILKGLPACGKSTWCKEQMEKHPGSYKRITKDMLRSMLDNGKHTKHSEKFIIDARDALILLSLEQGFHVLVDDTNLNPVHENHIRELVKGLTTVEIQDFTDVPLETCIERDRNRPNYVGEQVIRRMYNEFLYKPPEPPIYDPTLPIAILFDLDGTVALNGHRNPYDASTCAQDTLNRPVASILKSFQGTGAHFIALSGREDKYRAETERWLKIHELPYDLLLMRPTGDNRRDYIVKQELYEQHVKSRYFVHFILDDRTQCIRLWRGLGLTALQVADGDF